MHSFLIILPGSVIVGILAFVISQFITDDAVLKNDDGGMYHFYCMFERLTAPTCLGHHIQHILLINY